MKQEFKTQKLVGQYFHTYEYSNRTKQLEVVNQGCVEGKVTEEYYICQIFSFLDGSETNSKLVHVRDMKDWKLYKSNALMNEKYEHYYEGYRYRLAKTNISEEVA
tara:strand:+ start:256 stop:570 length:315 start_codon:yes stop_codon:yes gene_type:complete